MKRIINGLTYNTETATKIAKYEYDHRPDQDEAGYYMLYRTPGKAFFLHFHRTVQMHDETDGDGKSVRVTNDFSPMTWEEAHDWLLSGNFELFSDILGELPEASAEDNPGVTIYLRAPISFKEQIEAAAGAVGQSVNDWVLQCLKERLSETPK